MVLQHLAAFLLNCLQDTKWEGDAAEVRLTCPPSLRGCFAFIKGHQRLLALQTLRSPWTEKHVLLAFEDSLNKWLRGVTERRLRTFHATRVIMI